MHRDHPGAARSEWGTQAIRASTEEAARELEERPKNAVDKEFMHEEEAGEADSDALYLYVHDDNYCSVLEVSLWYVMLC